MSEKMEPRRVRDPRLLRYTQAKKAAVRVSLWAHAVTDASTKFEAARNEFYAIVATAESPEEKAYLNSLVGNGLSGGGTTGEA